MGGTPRWALVSLALPKSLPATWVDEFYRGLDGILAEFGAFVVGGNLSGAGRIIADLTLLGEVERGQVLTRKGARPGDLICVTGTLGRSAAGRAALDAGLDGAGLEGAIRAHLAPTPRVREGQALAATGVVTAMMDISDGLAGDLHHICESSDTGAAIDTIRLPIDPATFDVAARLGLDPVELALSGGEDFELLFTVAPGGLSASETALGDGGVTVVGEIHTSADGISINGRPRGMGGWDHFAEGGSRTV
jgi:thiamine-monophosphate kinase